MGNLNEYDRRPVWIDTMTKEQQYEWYLKIKASLPLWKKMKGDVSELEHAIKEYENRNGIV